MNMMTVMLMEMKGIDKLYAICAIFGGGLFIFRMIMQFSVGHVDFSGDIGGDMDAGTDVHDSDSDLSFKIFSLQSLTAFFMMFGLVGLALSMQTGWDETQSLAGGMGAGALSVYLIKIIYDQAKKLQCSGNIDLKKNAIGCEGDVYLNIPAEGAGQVQITVQNHLKIFDAMSANRTEIKTGTPVKVINIISNNVLVVERAL